MVYSAVLLNERLDDVDEAGVVVLLRCSGGGLLGLGSTNSGMGVFNGRVDEGADSSGQVRGLDAEGLSKLPDHGLDVFLVGNILERSALATLRS